jgi:mannose-6-phosphate isomerase-like protein (cupin superfamily)
MTPAKLNILTSVDRQITRVWDPHVVGDVNESQVKVAKFGSVFEWHAHPDEDEAFLVMRGRIAIDFRGGSVDLGEGDFLVVPRGTQHRPRSLTHEPVVLMVEPATTINTGDSAGEMTVVDLKRLA